MDSTEITPEKKNTCEPISTIADLLGFDKEKCDLRQFVEPLKDRSKARYLGDNCHQFSTECSSSNEIESRPQVLACHDYKGNYLYDKHNDGTSDWHEYRFYNWSCIDIFCYFSHNLVTIPTLQYLNSAHRHGVKVIGTFIVENKEGKSIINDEILKSEASVIEIAEKLAEICKWFRFDGWLLNLESEVNIEKIQLLKLFVSKLTEFTHQQVPGSKVIWYDSVIKSGELSWQNGLNEHNEEFFMNCDGIFLNYFWKDSDIEKTSEFVRKNHQDRIHDVFYGIDIFGRGQTAEFQTDLTLSKIVSYNFSVALFAIGWTYECMEYVASPDEIQDVIRNEINRIFFERNDRFWNSLYKYLPTFGPTELPFETNFCVGSGMKYFENGSVVRDEPWINLRKQNYQLSVPTVPGVIFHEFTDAFNGGSCLVLTTNDLRRIFVTDFPLNNQKLFFSYTFKKFADDDELDIHLGISDDETSKSFSFICRAGKCDSFDVELINEAVVNGWTQRKFFIILKNGSSYRLGNIGVQKLSQNPIQIGQIKISKD